MSIGRDIIELYIEFKANECTDDAIFNTFTAVRTKNTYKLVPTFFCHHKEKWKTHSGQHANGRCGIHVSQIRYNFIIRKYVKV